MSEYHHGVYLKYMQSEDPASPATQDTSNIVIYGVAPKADANVFPFKKHVNIFSYDEKEIYKLLNGGTKEDLAPSGTLWRAVDEIYKFKIKPKICLVRVDDTLDVKQEIANCIENISNIPSDTLGEINPKIVIAPDFTSPEILPATTTTKDKTKSKEGTEFKVSPVVTALNKHLSGVLAIGFIDGLNLDEKNDALQTKYRSELGHMPNIQIVDPYVTVRSLGEDKKEQEISVPASIMSAGLRAYWDYQKDFSEPISNKPLPNVVGTKRIVGYLLGKPNTESDLLNKKQIATIVRKKNEFRYLGLDVLADRTKEFYRLDHVRIRDIISEMLLNYLDNYVDSKFRMSHVQSALRAVNKELEEMARRGVFYGATFSLAKNRVEDLRLGKTKFRLAITYMEYMEQIEIEVVKSFDHIPENLFSKISA